MEGKLIFYYDAECEVCGRIRARLERSSRGDEFVFLDAHEVQPSGVSKEEALYNMYADDSGRLFAGGRVIPRFLMRYPAWRWLGYILAMPPFIWLCMLAYRMFADNRPFFSRFV